MKYPESMKENMRLKFKALVEDAEKNPDRPWNKLFQLERSQREDSCNHHWLKERGNPDFECMRCGALNSRETD